MRAQELPTAAQVQAAIGRSIRERFSASTPMDDPARRSDDQRRAQPHLFLRPSQSSGPPFAGNRLFESEHGESIDDEVNLVVPAASTGGRSSPAIRMTSRYIYSNWSASSAALRLADFNVADPPPAVPRQRESAAHVLEFRAAGEDLFHRAEHLRSADVGNRPRHRRE